MSKLHTDFYSIRANLDSNNSVYVSVTLSSASVPAFGICFLDDSDCVVAEIESLDLVSISLMAKGIDHFGVFIAHFYFFI